MERLVEGIHEITLSYGKLVIQMQKVGDDYHILMYGGEKPHIGCSVLTIPRESLKRDGTVSCTSSVLNITGHKDEAICRYLAEKIAVRHQAVTVCTGGFHMDDITKEQIEELMQVIRKL